MPGGAASIDCTAILVDHLQTSYVVTCTVLRPTYSHIAGGLYRDVELQIDQVEIDTTTGEAGYWLGAGRPPPTQETRDMADNFTFKDAAGTSKTHASTDLGSDVHVSHNIAVDAAGEPIFYAGSTVKSSAVSVSTSATALPSSALASRRPDHLQQRRAAIYLGASGVTTAAGVSPGRRPILALEVGTLAIYGIAAAGTVEARVMEIA